jgi:hypothetical protein
MSGVESRLGQVEISAVAPKKHSPMPIFLSAIFLLSCFLFSAPACQSLPVYPTPPSFAFSLFRHFAIKKSDHPAPPAFPRIESNPQLDQQNYFPL